jgi:hypothetical protein
MRGGPVFHIGRREKAIDITISKRANESIRAGTVPSGCLTSESEFAAILRDVLAGRGLLKDEGCYLGHQQIQTSSLGAHAQQRVSVSKDGCTCMEINVIYAGEVIYASSAYGVITALGPGMTCRGLWNARSSMACTVIYGSRVMYGCMRSDVMYGETSPVIATGYP